MSAIIPVTDFYNALYSCFLYLVYISRHLQCDSTEVPFTLFVVQTFAVRLFRSSFNHWNLQCVSTEVPYRYPIYSPDIYNVTLQKFPLSYLVVQISAMSLFRSSLYLVYSTDIYNVTLWNFLYIDKGLTVSSTAYQTEIAIPWNSKLVIWKQSTLFALQRVF